MDLNPLSLIVDGFKAVTGLVDEVSTTDEERMKLKNELQKTENSLSFAFIALEKEKLQLEQERIKHKADIIKAEAQGEGWLQKNWRPLLMVVFAIIIVAKWFGLTDANINTELERELMELIKIGVGGYIGSRGLEKIVLGDKTKMKSIVGNLIEKFKKKNTGG